MTSEQKELLAITKGRNKYVELLLKGIIIRASIMVHSKIDYSIKDVLTIMSIKEELEQFKLSEDLLKCCDEHYKQEVKRQYEEYFK